jgi:tetratricopeptide (TPR) repeat protein
MGGNLAVSRSVHETRRELEEVRRWEFGGRALRDDEVWLLEDRLAAKRRYKGRAARRRRVTAPADGGGAFEVITEPAVPHVHHPLSEEDIHALLALLPADVRPALRAVRRRAGLREDDMVDEDTEPDPLTGRHGYQREGGIWAPRLRGRFRPAADEIDLFAFVYDERALRVPEVQTVLLWLDQAETLAHEVAHAWDDSGRSSGDRWAMDQEDRAEGYAEEAARDWTGRYAAAYLERAHPERARAYDGWILSHAGIPIPLARVADDLDRSFWGVHIGLYDVCAAWDDAAALDLRTELAREFHYVDDFEPARQILELVLADDAEHTGATILMGDIAVHEQDWDRALRWTDQALRLAPDDLDAREDRVAALIGATRWADAAAAAGRALAMETEDDAAHVRLRLERARCLIELGDFPGADVDLESVVAGGVHRRVAAARALRAESLLRQERWPAARAEAIHALSAAPSLWPSALLTAVAWEAAVRSDDAGGAPVPTERHVEMLRWHGRGAWVDRMVEMGMVPSRHRVTRRQAALRRRQMGRLTRL